jgi:putative ribosome biogenesis GTPase RsgA
LVREINSVDSGIRIITGKYGIGKTSLLNITQLEVFKNNISYQRLLPA